MANGSSNYKLGEITGELKGINDKLDNLIGHMEKLDDRTDVLEKFNERLGTIGLLVVMVLGIVGGLIQSWLSKLFLER